jgi:hypothetical protein
MVLVGSCEAVRVKGNSGEIDPAGDPVYRDGLGIEDLRRAALAAADLNDPEIMDNAWR